MRKKKASPNQNEFGICEIFLTVIVASLNSEKVVFEKKKLTCRHLFLTCSIKLVNVLRYICIQGYWIGIYIVQ